MLAGVADSATNPIRLPDDVIVEFLSRIQEARDSFNRVYPHLLAEEKARLDLLTTSGRVVIGDGDHKKVHDDFQKSQNTVGIYTTGPYGGTRRGGN